MMIMSAPQTPRLKSKLSLDIPPSSYSDFNSPISPSSPFNPIPSPTLSGSWYVNKSQAELTVLIKEAYHFIKEKERDLTLAAEIGKSLLENNIALKAKYEVLLGQLHNLQKQKLKTTAATLQANAIKKPSAVPIAPPNSSLDPFMEDTSDFEESDTESTDNGYASSIDVHSTTSSDRIVRRYHSNNSGNKNKQKKRNHPTFNDIEKINELETINHDLQMKLEEVVRESDKSDKSNKTIIRKLEAELKHFQDAYSQATQKIEDLDKETNRLIQKQKEDFWQIKYDKTSLKNDEIIERLVNQVTELEQQNHNIENAKAETERKLSRVIGELDSVHEQFSELIDQSKNYEILQLENQEQSAHIIQLQDRLAQEQSKVVSLRSGILYSGSNSRSSSFSENPYSTLRRLSDPDRMRLFGTIPQTPTGPTPSSSGNGGGSGGLGGKIKRTLLSEFENEWFRELTLFQRDRKKSGGNDGSPPFSPVLSDRALSDYFLNNGSHADDDVSIIDYLSDSEFSFIDEFDTDNEKATRIREWFWRRWTRNVYLFFRLIWRWIKFILILIAANIMAIYRGPDDILPDDM